MQFKLAAIFTLSVLLSLGISWASPTDTPSPTLTATVTAVALEGYHGTGWGVSLNDFQSAQKSVTNNSVKRTEKSVLLHLLLNFHEAAKKDNYYPTQISIQKIDGDKTNYVFYNGHYRLAVVPIELKNLDAVRKEITSKYSAIKDLLTYTVQWTFRESQGWVNMDFDYQQYAKTPGTRIYLVTASSYNEDQGLVDQLHYGDVVQHIPGPKTLVSAYLIYISEDYFKSTDNAWTDYQATVTVKPALTPAAANLTPTPNNKENSKQQDLKSVE
jgi:hypothetical protein